MKDVIFLPENRFIWFLLALQGGMVNLAGLLAVHRFVSHVTGFASHFAIHVYESSYLQAIYALLVPLSFLFGSFMAAYFTEIKRRKNLAPTYFQVMCMIGFIYLFLASNSIHSSLGSFGEEFSNKRDFLLLILLCFSCGAQNALFTNYSKSIIRTTHLTGLTTDLGIGLAKQILMKDKNAKKLNQLRAELIVSFFIGSVIGVYIFKNWKFSAFLVCSILSFFIAYWLYKSRTKLSEELLD